MVTKECCYRWSVTPKKRHQRVPTFNNNINFKFLLKYHANYKMLYMTKDLILKYRTRLQFDDDISIFILNHN